MFTGPRNVLWPTDFSDLALKGGHYARALSLHFGAVLHVVHVVPPVLTPDFSVLVPAGMPVTASEPEVLDACRTTLDRIVRDEFGDDPAIVRAALLGNPWSGVCEYAQRSAIDLVVVTTHGRTGLRHALIGSTAEKIVQHAPCPVLAIKSTGRDFLDAPSATG